jgi:radical SAM protein with 4Fe4S-binding SPASM domain
MDYTPVTAVWEITMGCNMRCAHCGSSCTDPLPDELTTEEALNVCDDMKKLGMKWITLSGGEPLTRKDWPILAGRLYSNGIIPNIITNGWLVTEKMVKDAGAAGVETISISLDGVKSTHDKIRKEGSFDRVISALKILRDCRHVSGVNTTITRQNIGQMDALKQILIENGVNLWQLQIGLPMGNLKNNPESVIDPEDIDYLLDYAYRTTLEGKIKVFPADCLGYFTGNESITRQISTGSPGPVVWQGCNAGKRSFGLLHNGEVLGCTSIRERTFIEGNVRTRSLIDIWRDPNCFAWARNLKKSDLAGDCRECCYGDVCLGGCPNTRLTVSGSIYAENDHCSYNLALGNIRKTLLKYNDIPELMKIARTYVFNHKWQTAALTLKRLTQIEPSHTEALELLGYVHFSMGNFDAARDANEELLQKEPNNAYALKGMGLSLHRLNRSEEGIAYLKKSVAHSFPPTMDAYIDLSIVYSETGQKQQAIAALQEAETKQPGFINRVGDFYNRLLLEIGTTTTAKAEVYEFRR